MPLGTNWIPSTVNGVLLITNLPPANDIGEVFSAAKSNHRGRVYVAFKATIMPGEQKDLTIETTEGQTPLGKRAYTRVEFKLIKPLLGTYMCEWVHHHVDSVGFLIVSNKPKDMLLTFEAEQSEGGQVKMTIDAVEGVQAWQTFVAE